MNIVFYNPCRNGDVHVSRSYIIDIMNKLPLNNYYYIQNPNYTSGDILKDIDNLKISYDIQLVNPNSTITKIEDNIFINTWYGQSNMKYFGISKSKNKADDCSFYILYNIFIDVYDFLDIKIENFDFYLPKINYENIYTSSINTFLDEISIYQKKILVCDNPVKSGQSSNFNFLPIINELADRYKNYAFISTSNHEFDKDNIFSTSKIIGLKSDLNEISYLSIFCDVIIGRSSGPYTFSLVDENLTNTDKKFVAFTNKKITALALNDGDYACELIWSNNYDYNNIIDKIIQAL